MEGIFLVLAVLMCAIAATVSMTPKVMPSDRDARIQRNVVVLLWLTSLYTFGLAMRASYYLS